MEPPACSKRTFPWRGNEDLGEGLWDVQAFTNSHTWRVSPDSHGVSSDWYWENCSERDLQRAVAERQGGERKGNGVLESCGVRAGLHCILTLFDAVQTVESSPAASQVRRILVRGASPAEEGVFPGKARGLRNSPAHVGLLADVDGAELLEELLLERLAVSFVGRVVDEVGPGRASCEVVG